MKPLTSIVVSMYNAKEYVLDIVDNLFFPSLINNLSPDKQVIVVDDCSPAQKETDEIVEKHRKDIEAKAGDFKYIKNPENLGFGASYNRGFQAADGDTLLVINDDIYLTRGSVDALTQNLLEDPSYGLVGAVSPRQFSFQNSYVCPDPKDYSKQELEKLEKFAQWLKKAMQGKKYVLPNSRGMGSCFTMRNNDQAYFDERFKFGFWEDTDLNKRIIRAGYKSVLDASTYVWHHLGASTHQRKLRAAPAVFINGTKFMLKWKELKFLGEFAKGWLQEKLDWPTVTSDIKQYAQEKDLWDEYLQMVKE